MTTILRDEEGELAERIQQLGLGNKTKAEELAVRMRGSGALLTAVRDSIAEMERQHSRNIPTPAGFPFFNLLRRQARDINDAAALANRADDLQARQDHLQVRLNRANDRKDRSQRALQNTKDRIKALDKMANPKKPGLLYWRHMVRKVVTAPLLSTAHAQLTWQKLLNNRLSSAVDSLEPAFQASEVDARQGDEAVTDIKVGLQKSNETARRAWVAIQGSIDLTALSTAPPTTPQGRLFTLITNARAGQPTNYQQLANLLSVDVPLVAFGFQLQPANFWWATPVSCDTPQKRRMLQEQVREVVRAAESLRFHNNSGIAAMNIGTAKKLAGERIKALLDENTERNTEVTAAQAIYNNPAWHRDVATEPGVMRFRNLGAGWLFGPPLAGASGEEIRIRYNINTSGHTIYTLPDGTTTQDVASAIIETQKSTRRTALHTLIAHATGTPPILTIGTEIDTFTSADPQYTHYTFTTTLNQTGTPPVITGIKVAWVHTPLAIGGHPPLVTTGSIDIPLDSVPVRYIGTALALDVPLLETEFNTRMQTTVEGHNHTNLINTTLRPAIDAELTTEIAPAVLADFTGDIQVHNGTVSIDYTHTRLGENTKLDIPVTTFTTLPGGGFDPARIRTALSVVVTQMKKMHYRQEYIDTNIATIQTNLRTETQNALADYGAAVTVSYVDATTVAPIIPAQYRIQTSSFGGVEMVKDFDISQGLLDVTYDATSGVGTAHTLTKLVAEAKKQIQELDKEFKRIPTVLTRALLTPTPPVNIGNTTCTLNKITNRYTLRVLDMQGKATEYVLHSVPAPGNIEIVFNAATQKWDITLNPSIIADLSKSANDMSTAPTTAGNMQTDMNTSAVLATIPSFDELNATEGRFTFVAATPRKEAHYVWNIQSYQDIPVSGFELEIPFSSLKDPNDTTEVYGVMTDSDLFKELTSTLQQIESHDLLFEALETEAAKNPLKQAKWLAKALSPSDFTFVYGAINTVELTPRTVPVTYSLKDFLKLSFRTRRRTKATMVTVEFGSLVNKILNAL